jgi:4-aminobutyrate aminotransferase/(S)-3-amino-2-methylpropionate transaminase
MSDLGTLLPSLRTTPPGPRSLALAERLRGVESRHVTFLSERFPVFWEEARGANVRDVDGNVYVDFTGAFGVSFAGHAHPDIGAAIDRQSRRLVHGMGDVHPPAGKVELLERLSALGPWDDTRVFLASSGSEAVEFALKTVELGTGRSGLVAFEGSYHGLTLGSLAVTGRREFRDPFKGRLYDGVAFVAFPSSETNAQSALSEVAKVLAEGTPTGAPVGAIVVEPIQGRAGVRIPPPGFLARLTESARSAGALVIFDEIFTGLGRTGTLFACEHEGVLPDLMCIGKSLGGGLPLSACLGPSSLLDAWPASEGEALHTSTFLGHPLACATALAFLDVLEGEGLCKRANEIGHYLLEEFTRGLGTVSGVKEVRGRGLFIGIELCATTGEPLAGGAVRVAEAALRKGLLVLPAGKVGEVVEITPPAVSNEKQIDFGIACLLELVAAEAAGH